MIPMSRRLTLRRADNNVGLDGAAALASALRVNTTLEVVNLGGTVRPTLGAPAVWGNPSAKSTLSFPTPTTTLCPLCKPAHFEFCFHAFASNKSPTQAWEVSHCATRAFLSNTLNSHFTAILMETRKVFFEFFVTFVTFHIGFTCLTAKNIRFFWLMLTFLSFFFFQLTEGTFFFSGSHTSAGQGYQHVSSVQATTLDQRGLVPWGRL